MTDKDIWAVKVGPVVVGGVSERKPDSPLFTLLAWAVTVFLVGTVAPFLAIVLIILSAMFLAVKTAPADDERTQR